MFDYPMKLQANPVFTNGGIRKESNSLVEIKQKLRGISHVMVIYLKQTVVIIFFPSLQKVTSLTFALEYQIQILFDCRWHA